jgi:cob(I)alamin adenosyltransferase
MKIYTRTGDSGSTGLIGGSRLPKSHPLLSCTGALDELNASLGLCAATASDHFQTPLHNIQHELFILGAQLSTPADSPHAKSLPVFPDSAIARLEAEIDAADAKLPPLREFILPGGCELAARLHLSRTICRRAERVLVEFARGTLVPEVFLAYINRLSDHLFTYARLANYLAGVSDIPWKKPI